MHDVQSVLDKWLHGCEQKAFRILVCFQDDDVADYAHAASGVDRESYRKCDIVKQRPNMALSVSKRGLNENTGARCQTLRTDGRSCDSPVIFNPIPSQ